MITQKRLKEIVTYNKNTGEFKRFDGKKFGSINNGYLRASIDGKSYYTHRLAWLYEYGHIPSIIDHKNMNRLDNRIKNLLNTNTTGNMKNRSLDPRSYTGINGVAMNKRGGFRSYITVNGKTKSLGEFKSKVLAYEARLDANCIYDFRKEHGHVR